MTMRHYRYLNIINLLLATSLTSSLAWASSNPFAQKKYSINGFFSQAAIYSSDNNFFGESDDSVSIEYTELGAVLNAKPFKNFQFSGQLLGLRNGRNEEGKIRLDFAFLTYSFINTFDWNSGFRLGRLKAPFGLYGDTRDVAFTRPSIFLPQSIYFDRVRNTGFSQDGLQFFAEQARDTFNWTWQFAVVDPTPDEDEIKDFSSSPLDSKVDGQTSYVSRLLIESATGQHKAAISYTYTGYELNFEEFFLNFTTDTLVTYALLSYQFNNEKMTIDIEIMDLSVDLEKLEFIRLPESYYQNGLSQNIQLTYRLKPDLNIIARYDAYYINRNDRHGKLLEDLTSASNSFGLSLFSFPAHSAFAKNYLLGLSWNFSKNWLARIEYHQIQGTGWLSRNDNPIPLETAKHWHMLAGQISFRF